jgi:hypothetical protein
MKKLIAVLALSCLVSGVFAEPLSLISHDTVQSVHHPKKKKESKSKQGSHRKELRSEKRGGRK